MVSASIFFSSSFSSSPINPFFTFRMLVMATLPIIAHRFPRPSLLGGSLLGGSSSFFSSSWVSLSFLMVETRALPKLFSIRDFTFLMVSESSSSSSSFPVSSFLELSLFSNSSLTSSSSSRISLPHRDEVCFSMRASLLMRFSFSSGVSFFVVSFFNQPSFPFSGLAFRTVRGEFFRMAFLVFCALRKGETLSESSPFSLSMSVFGGAFARCCCCCRSFQAGTFPPGSLEDPSCFFPLGGIGEAARSSPNSSTFESSPSFFSSKLYV
mmetsp:Transcript_1811/g.4215  ORF Transcript_1811/g.4215 Transcript_1811/m.4215 type:complete len:267 (-) Transcript_1811:472-1272(-)